MVGRPFSGWRGRRIFRCHGASRQFQGGYCICFGLPHEFPTPFSWQLPPIYRLQGHPCHGIMDRPSHDTLATMVPSPVWRVMTPVGKKRPGGAWKHEFFLYHLNVYIYICMRNGWTVFWNSEEKRMFYDVLWIAPVYIICIYDILDWFTIWYKLSIRHSLPTTDLIHKKRISTNSMANLGIFIPKMVNVLWTCSMIQYIRMTPSKPTNQPTTQTNRCSFVVKKPFPTTSGSLSSSVAPKYTGMSPRPANVSTLKAFWA